MYTIYYHITEKTEKTVKTLSSILFKYIYIFRKNINIRFFIHFGSKIKIQESLMKLYQNVQSSLQILIFDLYFAYFVNFTLTY